MKSREILRRLVRRFGLLLLLTLIGGGAGAIYAAVKTPTYTAKAYVVTISAGAEPIVALNYAQAYGRIATTGPVLATAETRLGGERAGLNRVTAATSPDAPVIEITATGNSPSRTANVANAVAGSLIALGDTRKGDTKVGLAMLASATPPAKPTSPKPPMELAIGAAAGLLIGGLAVLAGVGRKTEEQVEEKREEAQAARYEAYTPEEQPAPAEIDRYMGVWRSKKPALTATPEEKPETIEKNAAADDDDEQASTGEKEPVRVVGRAVVFRVEEK